MAAVNEITGDLLTSRVNNQAYASGYDEIFNGVKRDDLEPLLRDALQTIQAALGQVDDCSMSHVKLAEDVHTLARQLKLTVFKSHADVCGGVVYKDRVKQGVSPSAEVSEI